MHLQIFVHLHVQKLRHVDTIYIGIYMCILDHFGSFWAFRFEAMVLGAGRGPLVEATLKAAERAEAGYVGLVVLKCSWNSFFMCGCVN